MAAWSEADLKMLRGLALGRASLDAICARLARSKSSVKMELFRQGFSSGNPRLPINSRELEVIKGLAKSGHGTEVIARTLSRSNATIRLAAKKYKIEIRAPRGGLEINFSVEQRVLLKIRAAAAARNTTTKAIVAALVERIAERNMFGVVLDSRDLPTITSRAAMRAEV